MLPSEVERKMKIKVENISTDETKGCDPYKRSVEELLEYGVINLNKPKGPTSHLVSDHVKKILGVSKAGHGGTLDPGVTGVLPVAIGRATRIIQTILKGGKEYVAIMHLHEKVDEDKIRDVAKKFVGKINQMPPVKSAVVRRVRTRKVYYIDILEINGQDVLFKVGCEAGTYVRKLCLHPSTEIITQQGIVKASEFYINPKNVYSKKDALILEKMPSQVQKLKSPKTLIKLSTHSGIDIIVTPDHKMLVSTPKGYIMRTAEKIKQGDYLVKSNKMQFISKNYIIADLLDDNYLIAQNEIKTKCKKEFIKKYGSIREMNRQLKLDRKVFLSNSKNSISIKHLKLAGVYEKLKRKISTFKTEKGRIIKLKKLTKDHFYLMGLIASDGNNTREKNTIRNTRLKFHNKQKILIDKFEKTYKKLFPNIAISNKKVKNNLFQLDTSNSLFATICASLGIKSPYKYSDLLPILEANNALIKSFLRGYFDGDGTAYFKKKAEIKGNYSNIRIYSTSKINIKRIHQMLLKLNIINRILELNTKFGRMFAIEIDSISSKKEFIRQIGTNHPIKKIYFNKILKIKTKEKLGDNQYVGLHFKKNLEKEKTKLKQYLGGNLSRILKTRVPVRKGVYEKCTKLVKITELDNFVIEKITKTEPVSSTEFVYDMTVPETHNFLIETGFVSSNCHDIGQKLKVNAHMSELIRTKAGPFNDSDWVTLQDLEDAFYFWKEGDDKEIRRCILPPEVAINHLPKIWVDDSCVVPLCHGSDLKVPGVIKLNDFNVKGLVAVMTLKDELICIGQAMMTSKAILKEEKGLAIKVEKVFMKLGVY